MVESGAFTHLTDVMIRWSPGIWNEISPKRFHGRLADLIMIQWSLGVSTIEGDFYVRTAVPSV